MTYSKKEAFSTESKKLAILCKVLSHPARVEILKYLASQKQCISGDITNYIPLSRTTVSQHLQELKNAGFIHGEVSGTKVNYCLCGTCIKDFKSLFDSFLSEIDINRIDCKTDVC